MAFGGQRFFGELVHLRTNTPCQRSSNVFASVQRYFPCVRTIQFLFL